MTITEFAQRVQKQEQVYLIRHGLDCEANWKNTITTIKTGRKWTRVDVGYSGRYMVDQAGNIYTIKAYGVPPLGHPLGTLDNPSPRLFAQEARPDQQPDNPEHLRPRS